VLSETGSSSCAPTDLLIASAMARSSGGRPGRRRVGRALHRPEECATSLFHQIRDTTARGSSGQKAVATGWHVLDTEDRMLRSAKSGRRARGMVRAGRKAISKRACHAQLRYPRARVSTL